MKKRFLIPIFVIVALVTGLFLGTIGSAAIYNQPLYSTTVSTDLQKDAANQRNGGQVYYVDGNVINDSGDGTSWATAYQKAFNCHGGESCQYRYESQLGGKECDLRPR